MQARLAILPLLLCTALGLHAQVDPRVQRLFDLTNQARADQGLPLLQWNNALEDAAQAHANRMIQERTLAHQYSGEADLATRTAQAGARFRAVAENIAYGSSPSQIQKEWMHSPGHRANILDPQMNSIGIAVAERGGYLYAVQDFSSAIQQLDPGQIEQTVSAQLSRQGIDPSGPRDEAREACRMSHGIPGGSSAMSVVRYQTPDLSRLPAPVTQQLQKGMFTQAAVGACAPSSQSSFTSYRIAILFYTGQ